MLEVREPYGGCLGIIGLGIVALWCLIIAYLVTVVSFSSTIAVRMCYIVSVVLMILCFAFICDKNQKYTASAVVAIIYAIVFSNAEFSWKENELLVFLMPLTLLFPCWIVGSLLNLEITAGKKQTRENKIKKMDETVKKLLEENIDLRQKTQNRLSMLGVVQLLGKCGGDITAFESHGSFSEISDMKKKMDSNKERIKTLTEEIDRLSQAEK